MPQNSTAHLLLALLAEKESCLYQFHNFWNLLMSFEWFQHWVWLLSGWYWKKWHHFMQPHTTLSTPTLVEKIASINISKSCSMMTFLKQSKRTMKQWKLSWMGWHKCSVQSQLSPKNLGQKIWQREWNTTRGKSCQRWENCSCKNQGLVFSLMGMLHSTTFFSGKTGNNKLSKLPKNKMKL